MGDEVITKVLRRYGVKHSRLLAIQKGYRNESHPIVLENGDTLNLILYKSEPNILSRIKRANAIADYLSNQGLPTRKTHDTRTISLSSGNHIKYGALYTYLQGKTIPWEAYTQEHLKVLGQTMSDMHYHLSRFPNKLENNIADEYSDIFERMCTYFSQITVQKALRSKLNLSVDIQTISNSRKILIECKKLKGQQPLHMDFVRGNVLFKSPKSPVLSGILDFEKTSQGHPLFDISRTLAFLFIDCKFKSETKIRKYFLYSGYTKRGKATLKDVRIKKKNSTGSLLEQLVTIFLLHDFYKFLRHNPYESLESNEHFVRTRNILVSRNCLSFDRIHITDRGDSI
jgi:Ser/Thr protein kinase RdoA (MazF antagonist)